MKKLLVLLLTVFMIFSVTSCGKKALNEDYRVAMISDTEDVYDGSFNQAIYEALKSFGKDNSVKNKYYIKKGDSTSKRVETIEEAINDDFNVIILPGSSFVDSLKEVAPKYTDVKFISIDVANSDLGDFKLGDNVYCASYQEELAGFMAGYAAVKLGNKHLGFVGGYEYPSIKRYGYGFIQGVEYAAAEGNLKDVDVKFGYTNSFAGNENITSYMEEWYRDDTDVIFSCGGGIYTSVAAAAFNCGGKVIGVDVDQSYIIDSSGQGITLTSAMKNLGLTVTTVLDEMINNDNWVAYGGNCETLGMVSGDNPEENFVQIPLETTLWNDKYSQNDYKDLVSKLFNKEISVSGYIDNIPKVKTITVDYQGVLTNTIMN